MKTIAIIDMGTNTFHLLLAAVGPGGYRIILRDHEAVKIGVAGINEGLINPNACHRALAAMKRFRQIMNDNGVVGHYAFATSAFRNASNGVALAREIEDQTGIRVTIISGEEEAELIFAGIRAGLDLGGETSMVMDIGAGSVEFIIGSRDRIFWKQSFEIGGQRLLEKFQKHDPILPSEVAMLDAYFDDVLAPLSAAVVKYKPVTLVGSSGSFDTLSDIFCIRHNIPRTYDEAETPLTFDGFYDIYHELISKDRATRMTIPGMIALRVDMIVVACCLIRWVLESHDFKSIRVSSYSLKEGALANIAKSMSASASASRSSDDGRWREAH
jgi:exopolyphosphatase/guanosine-5'-triphosphate,3'-diphosphate pyrophosphatase